jgi:hypothetical protein
MSKQTDAETDHGCDHVIDLPVLRSSIRRYGIRGERGERRE